MKVDQKPGMPMHDLDPTKASKLSGKGGSAKTSSVGASALGDSVGGADSASSSSGSSKVDLSTRAQMMAKAKEIASRPDTIDEAKVARLQKLIDEGKYKTDSSAIADRLIDEHMSFPE